MVAAVVNSMHELPRATKINAQNLIRLKRNIQGYKTQLPVEIILGGIEFSGEC
jgi:hypothetical protein